MWRPSHCRSVSSLAAMLACPTLIQRTANGYSDELHDDDHVLEFDARSVCGSFQVSPTTENNIASVDGIGN